MTALPYHRLARASASYRWWRPLVELLAFAGLVFVAWLVVFPILIKALGEADAGAAGLLKLALAIAVALPMTFLAAKLAGRAPGMLSSVAGRVRWRWLAVCAAAALALVVVNLGVYFVAGALGAELGPPRGGWVGWDEFLPLAGVVICVIPLQAAAEEYVFRGTLLQAIGAWVPVPAVAIAISSVVFALAHGLGPEGFVAIAAFGLVMAWLTVHTGGLEAALALHVTNNVGLFLLDAATGRGGVWVTELNADLTWTATAIDLATNVLYGAIIARLYARRASPPCRSGPAAA